MARNINAIIMSHTKDESLVFISRGLSREGHQEFTQSNKLETTVPTAVRIYDSKGKAVKATDLMDRAHEAGTMFAMNANGTGLVMGNLTEIVEHEDEPFGATKNDDGEITGADATYWLGEFDRNPQWSMQGVSEGENARGEKVEPEAKATGGGGSKPKPKVEPKEFTVLGDCVARLRPDGTLGYKMGHDSKCRSAIHAFHDGVAYRPLDRVPTIEDFHNIVSIPDVNGEGEREVDLLFEISGKNDKDGLPDVGHARHEPSEAAVARAERAAAREAQATEADPVV